MRGQVILCGAVCDFRLQYGNAIAPRAALVAVNKCRARARQNRAPTLAVEADPASFLIALSRAAGGGPGGDGSADAEAGFRSTRERTCFGRSIT